MFCAGANECESNGGFRRKKINLNSRSDKAFNRLIGLLQVKTSSLLPSLCCIQGLQGVVLVNIFN